MKPQKKKIDPFAKLIKDIEIPNEYEVDPSGVYKINREGEDDRISESPLIAKAYTRDTNSENWKILLAWLDLDKKIREEAFDRSLVMEGKAMIKELLQKGFQIKASQTKNFQDYLNELSPTKRMLHVDKLGWYDNNEGKLSFVLPDKVIGTQQEEEIFFQPGSYAPTLDSMTQKGSFENWQSEIAEKTKGNPILIFCLSAAFVGPLVKLLGAETGGFHIYGKSSHGKTTAMQVAASVWGNGESPTNSTSPPFIRTWAATTNALEGIAAAHNDSLMILDELGQCDATDFQKIVYDLAAGQGKARMTKNASLAAPKTWRNIYLSTGELSAKNRLESAKQKAKEGQMLRLMDIPTDEGIIVETGDITPAKFADRLKENCAKNYGWAGPAFVEKFLREIKDDPESDFQVLEENYKYYQNELKNDDLESGQNRALTRLALVWLAGKLACEFGMIPLDEIEDIEPAMHYIKKIWLKANKTLTDAGRAVRDIRDFLTTNQEKFPEWNDKYADKFSEAGYSNVKEGITLYMFHQSAFQGVCKDVPVKNVCHELIKMKFFSQNDKPKLVSRYKRGSERQSFYVVSSRILSHDFGDD